MEHSAKVGRLANEATDPSMKADFLQLEKRWLRLAQSYEFVERLEAFLLNGRPEAPINFHGLADECVRLARSAEPLDDNARAALLEMSGLLLHHGANADKS